MENFWRENMLPRLGRAERIPDVLAEFTDTLASSNQPLAMFSALYWRITSMIRAAPSLGRSAWIAQVQLNFYGLFAQAWHRHKRGNPNPPPWKLVFLANQDPTLGPARQLLLGVNAHMCQDLIMALLMSELGLDLKRQRREFFALNALFMQESQWLVERICQAYQWPLNAQPALTSLTRLGMAIGRHESWLMALTLHKRSPQAQQRYLTNRAQALEHLGSLILTTPLLGSSCDPDHAQVMLQELRSAPPQMPDLMAYA